MVLGVVDLSKSVGVGVQLLVSQWGVGCGCSFCFLISGGGGYCKGCEGIAWYGCGWHGMIWDGIGWY